MSALGWIAPPQNHDDLILPTADGLFCLACGIKVHHHDGSAIAPGV